MPRASAEPPEYLLLSDADIGYAADSLSRQVAIAAAGGYALVSRMAKLRCENLAERALIPAFIFFFQMLFPFAWVNRADRRTAAAAGGCMLVHRRDLEAAGGIAAIRGALIDDCALAAQAEGAGADPPGTQPARGQPAALSSRWTKSAAWWRARPMRSCAFRRCCCWVRYSGMALIYVAPPALAIFAHGRRAAAGHPRLARHGARLPADLALLSPVAASGAWRCRQSRRCICSSPSIPPGSTAGPRRHVEGPRPGARHWRHDAA